MDEPRTHRVITSIKYVLSLLLGLELINVAVTPGVYLGVLWSAVAAGSLLIVGSVLGAIFALSKRWIWERPAIMLTGLGGVITAYVALYDSIVNMSLAGDIAFLFVIMFELALLDRFLEIYSDDYEITDKEINQAADKILSDKIAEINLD